MAPSKAALLPAHKYCSKFPGPELPCGRTFGQALHNCCHLWISAHINKRKAQLAWFGPDKEQRRALTALLLFLRGRGEIQVFGLFCGTAIPLGPASQGCHNACGGLSTTSMASCLHKLPSLLFYTLPAAKLKGVTHLLKKLLAKFRRFESPFSVHHDLSSHVKHRKA